jgi:hypothetical protein
MAEKTDESININCPEDRLAFEKCLAFLSSIGIQTVFRQLRTESFLPGLSIEEGCIVIDMHALGYPGDVLHEAGHIAVVPGKDRATLQAASIGQREHRDAEEMMAIAWSYAACVHLGLDPYFVFHDKGYKGGGGFIADNFRDKRYFGVPMLQWKGLTVDEKNAAIFGMRPYPHMTKWMLD